jgi:hypothetical protein
VLNVGRNYPTVKRKRDRGNGRNPASCGNLSCAEILDARNRVTENQAADCYDKQGK